MNVDVAGSSGGLASGLKKAGGGGGAFRDLMELFRPKVIREDVEGENVLDGESGEVFVEEFVHGGIVDSADGDGAAAVDLRRQNLTEDKSQVMSQLVPRFFSSDCTLLRTRSRLQSNCSILNKIQPQVPTRIRTPTMPLEPIQSSNRSTNMFEKACLIISEFRVACACSIFDRSSN
ncbi:Uncharacterized protein Fot_36579 [Forsythia ovata]|uniref:Uncharacterized protein n=1 Tax=Forsythia ovata TaxID=205694 RepID=A0ABD1SPT8_9LAMI